MARGPNSVEFCGVKLVRWGYRPRRAVKVMLGYCTLALLKNGSVACSADSPFDNRKRGWRRDPQGQTYLNEHLANDLLELGAITKAQHTAHMAKFKARLTRRKIRAAANDILNNAGLLGIKFTIDQSRLISQGEQVT